MKARTLTTGLRATAVAAALSLLAACGGSGEETTLDEDGLYGSARMASEAVRTPLVNTAGEKVNLSTDLDKKVTLAFFGYTHCPDICLAVMGTLGSAMKKLDPEVRDQVQVVFISTDPARDTPKVLRSYLDRFDTSFEGLTTNPKGIDTIVAAGRTYGIAIDENPQLITGGYDIIHQDFITGLNEKGEATTVWNRDVSQTEITHDLEKLVNQ